jgi:uncharacterized protein
MNPLRAYSYMILIALLLSGCARSPAARFYLLTPLPAAGKVAQGEASRAWIKVLPVQIPDYLDRRQIVTRTGSNSLNVAEYHRWAGSLGDNMTAVVAEDLGSYLSSERVFAAPGLGGAKPDYLVSVQVLRLDAIPGEHLLLKARWSIRHGQGQEDAAGKEGSFSEQLSDRLYETVAAGISRALGRLSGEMAREIGLMSLK